MKCPLFFLALAGFMASPVLLGQNNSPDPADAQPTLRISSRAVLVDVVVTDHKGNPIAGLPREAFTVSEQGQAQTVDFFEEHKSSQISQKPAETPQLPPNVFSNFSPFAEPPVVTLLLLDTLNTRTESQLFVHKQALKFLKTAKPGERMAIFTMGLGLHFIQGFNDDPAVLTAALNDKKNLEIENSVMLKSQAESNAVANVVAMMSAPAPGLGGGTVAPPEAIAALQNFVNENDASRSVDRIALTLANLQKLATFLEGFPGRKNIIWLAESFPSLFVTGSGDTAAPVVGNPAFVENFSRTLAMLAASRAVLYPVDARGLGNYSVYTAEMNSPANANFSAIRMGEAMARNSDQLSMQFTAEESGGKAFANVNGISEVMSEIVKTSGDFYTLAYTPSNPKMDGAYRRINIKIKGENYKLSYRRGYFAMDEALPGSSLVSRSIAFQRFAVQHHGIDPLLPFMSLGMPQTQQIVFQEQVQPAAQPNDASSGKKDEQYNVDFAVDLPDLTFITDSDGVHHDAVNISLTVYDRYGNIVIQKNRIATLNADSDRWTALQEEGVKIHTDIAIPKGHYWLRTGIYDQGSGKVGTLEIPVDAVKVATAATD